MIIIGDDFIPFEKIEIVSKIEDIVNTAPNSTLIFDFDKTMMKYCMDNSLQYGVKINSLKEAVYANGLRAKYILPCSEILDQAQKSAENYLFDTKVLAQIENEDEIEQFAIRNIDGAIFKKLLK